jgi:hypothetical protein
MGWKNVSWWHTMTNLLTIAKSTAAAWVLIKLFTVWAIVLGP